MIKQLLTQKLKNVNAFIYILFLAVPVMASIKPLPVYADTLGSITQHTIPTASSKPYGIVEGPDGNLWFTEGSKNKVGKMTKSGVFTEYNIGYVASSNHITVGPDSALWFSQAAANKVGRITTDGAMTHYTLPGTNNQPAGLITGPDGRLWISAYAQKHIFRMTTSGSTETINISGRPVETTADHARDLVWFAAREVDQNGAFTGNGWIGKIDMNGQVTEYATPSGLGNLFSVTMGPDGNVWFSAGGDKTGYVTESGQYTVYTLPTSNSGVWRVRAGLDGNVWATLYNVNKLVRITLTGSITEYFVASGSNPLGLATGSDGNMWFTEYGGNKISKIGTGVSGSTTDSDSDGLTASQEVQQGTSDQNSDTDGDGLSDLTESQWFTDRDAVFCNSNQTTCDYPSPLQKDIYVEVDWMVKPDPGGYSMKPTSAQTSPVIDAFSNKGINLHFDTGQLGGGNEVPYSESINFDPNLIFRDFYDYKNGSTLWGLSANFNSNRYHIYRYMIFGNKYTFQLEANTSSGIAYVGDDDSFISYGMLKDNGNSDTAISGTIIHELGHNLCLSRDVIYSSQSNLCVYDGIDNNSSAYTNYVSSMNYTYQFTMVDYSTGPNGGSIDHNDWLAVLSAGIDDFISSETGDDALHGSNGGSQGGMRARMAAPVIKL